MNPEPSEWHTFGDPPAHEGAAGASSVAIAAPAQPLSRAAAHRNAWLAVGLTILITIVALAVFVTTVAVAGTGHGEGVVIATKNGSVTGGQAGRTATAMTPRSPEAGGSPVDVGVTAGSLLVDVEGAVRAPGLHSVAPGSRVGDAITAAGGYAARADLGAAAQLLNLAQLLTDGAKIRVPVLGLDGGMAIDSGPGHPSAPSDGPSQPGSALIDLNHADQAALESLPGIGPVTAAKVIAARATGPFASLEDVVSRKALSTSVMDKIRALVTVSP